MHPQLDGRIDNKNSKKYLQSVQTTIMEQIRYLNHAPSVQMYEIPPDLTGLTEDEDKAIQELNEDMERDEKIMKDETKLGELMT
ncbi:Uncharacterised protein [Chlamydia trachomatis]|nr:Uncharacterised protein [Chlamydia trachomatis]